MHEVTPADSFASIFTTKILLPPDSLPKRLQKKKYITMQLGPNNFGSEVEDGQVWFKVVDKSIHERQKMLQFDACFELFLINNKLHHGQASGDGHCFFIACRKSCSVLTPSNTLQLYVVYSETPYLLWRSKSLT